jgi:hypothetical protein
MKQYDPHEEDNFDDFAPEEQKTSIVVNIAGIIIGVGIVLYCFFKLIEISI